MVRTHVVALVFLGLLGNSGCKAKPQEKSSDEPASAPAGEPASAAAQEPAAEAVLSRAEEEAVIKEFVTRFTDAIDADDATRWPAVITKERAARYTQEGVINEVYAAWRQGTATVSDRIRQAPFRLRKDNGKMTLYFDGVIVANDPETGYSIAVVIEDGVMYLDEN